MGVHKNVKPYPLPPFQSIVIFIRVILFTMYVLMLGGATKLYLGC